MCTSKVRCGVVHLQFQLYALLDVYFIYYLFYFLNLGTYFTFLLAGFIVYDLFMIFLTNILIKVI